MSPEFPHDQEESTEDRRRPRMIAAVQGYFRRHRSEEEQPNQLRVTGDGAAVIGSDAIPILSETLREKYGVDPGKVTIIAQRVRRPDKDL